MLAINNIEVIYDHVILVLKGVSLTVPEGRIVALLGANGAGKTTTLKAISNLLRSERGDVTKGSIEYRGDRIDRLSPSELVRRGVVQVMEGRHCFQHLTVEENLLTGAFTRSASRGEIAGDLEKVYTYFPRLKVRRKSQSGYTSGGEQQMTAVGRALMARPSMILLDEPSMGLAPQVVEEIFEGAVGEKLDQAIVARVGADTHRLGVIDPDADAVDAVGNSWCGLHQHNLIIRIAGEALESGGDRPLAQIVERLPRPHLDPGGEGARGEQIARHRHRSEDEGDEDAREEREA